MSVPKPSRLPPVQTAFTNDMSWTLADNSPLAPRDALPGISAGTSSTGRVVLQTLATHARFVIAGSLMVVVGVTVMSVAVHYAGEPDHKDKVIPSDPRPPDFTATLRLRSPSWSSDLNNTNSTEFKQLASHLEHLIDLMYEDSDMSDIFNYSVATGFDSPDGETTEVALQLFLSGDSSASEEQMEDALGQGCSALLQTKINREVVKIDCSSRAVNVLPPRIPDGQCGMERLYPRTSSGRIFGGNATEWYGVYPWVVMILKQGQYLCGGTVWDAQHILTAATCIFRMPHIRTYNSATLVDVSTLEVIAGKWRFAVSDPWLRGQRVRVSRAGIHAGYKHETVENDIAMLKLERPLELNQVVEPICHPTENMTRPDNGTVAGWGSVNETDTVNPSQLMYTNVGLYNQADCQGKLGIKISETTICGLLSGGTCPVS
ncbi:hypothetical protein BaRGS_00029800 [Batillaria attramentaria]|uniref:Peptidase S1 domain-containing protein n=1 Tax=Batillaria attramentaria TaxID=370345 RepID=A0ABD0JWH7_9CAEN